MALIMGAAMMVIMLSFMLGMYRNRAINLSIYAGAVLLFVLSLWLVRSQITVTGVDYMEAMIPHHSIAILTSERALASRTHACESLQMGSSRHSVGKSKRWSGLLPTSKPMG